MGEIPKVILEGKHEEIGILVVEEPVVIRKEGEQMFVFHHRVDNDVIFHLVAALAISGRIDGINPQILNITAMQRRDRNVKVTTEKVGATEKPVAVI